MNDLVATFFAIFYFNDAYLTLRDAEFLQRALTIFVGLYEQVGFLTNIKKTQVMICTPGQIRTQQLPFNSYHRMMHSRISAAEWNA